MAASLTDTHGIIAIAAAAAAVVALIGCVALAVSLRRLRRAQKAVLGTPPGAGPRSPRGRRPGRPQRDPGGGADQRRAAGRAARGNRAGAAGSHLPPRAGPLRRLQRALRAPVDVDRPARRRTLGHRAVVHPPPRPGARLRQAGARRDAPNSSSPPRRPRRCAWRSPAARARGRLPLMAGPADEATELPRAGYLGPEGTFSEEALLGSARPGRGAAGGPGEHLRHGDGAQGGRAGLGGGADRELARWVDQRDARPTRGGGLATWRSWARRC